MKVRCAVCNYYTKFNKCECNLDVSLKNRNCIDCNHFSFSPGEPGYSELTPGWEASMSCSQCHWNVRLDNITEEEYRLTLHTAMICPDFNEAPDVQLFKKAKKNG